MIRNPLFKRVLFLGISCFFSSWILSAQTVNSNQHTNGTSRDTENTRVESTSQLPGFPVFVNTGNPEIDNANYAAAKEKWISENQELYNKYLQSLKTNKANSTAKGNPSTSTVTQPNKD